MKLNYCQQLIVTGMMKHRRDAINKRFAGVGNDVGLSRGLSREAWQRRRLAIYDAQAGLVPMRLARLLGHVPTLGERIRFHREYARLEAMGLLERHYLSGGRRATHLRLTEVGQRVAENLLAEKADAVTNDIATDDDGFPLLQLLGWQADCPADAVAGTVAADEPASPPSPPSTPDTTSLPLPAPTTACTTAQ